MKRKLLIVIDMQKDFVDGSLGSKQAQAIVPRVQELIDSDEFDITLFTRDTHNEDYLDNTLEGKMLPVKHCIYETDGWQLVVKPKIEEYNGLSAIIDKYTFGSTNLVPTITEAISNFESTYRLTIPDIAKEFIDTITIVGLCTDICVISNALLLRAEFPDTRIICDASACAGVTPHRHECALEVMRSCQIEVINTCPDMPNEKE